VHKADLKYESLQVVLKPFTEKGRGESIAFLNWFLENVFRLDTIAAEDAICDHANDKGIDGIVVDHTQEEVLILQGKLKQKQSTLGDKALRDLVGAIDQVKSEDAIQALLDGGAHADLKHLLVRLNVKDLIGKRYRIAGVFVTNIPLDQNGRDFLDAREEQDIRVYDCERIAREFVDIEQEGGVEGAYIFDASYVEPMIVQTGDRAVSYMLPIRAIELASMPGIDDGSLFSQNVRLSLGNTKVNKALRKSIEDSSEHENFLLYHNGVNILCKEASLDEGQLKIKDFVVVNGAQSISSFSKAADSLTNDLRVIAKVTEIDDPSLSRKITINSNNQNAIKPRDLKSNNHVQLRLREEFQQVEGGQFELEIKRGQPQREGTVLITNEEAARLLLAFDLNEPESCHQIYKLFDEKYADIFGRKSVNAYRIILLHLIMERIRARLDEIEHRPLSRYGLTRFFLFSVVAALMAEDSCSDKYMKNPEALFEEELVGDFLDAVASILSSVIVDLNYEVEDQGDDFDYKGDLKSTTKVTELRNRLLRSFEKDVKRGKAETFEQILAGQETQD